MTRRTSSPGSSSESSSSSSGSSKKLPSSIYHDTKSGGSSSSQSDETLPTTVAGTPDRSSSAGSRTKEVNPSSTSLVIDDQDLEDDSNSSNVPGSVSPSAVPQPLFVRVAADPKDLSDTRRQVQAAIARLTQTHHSPPSSQRAAFMPGTSATDVTSTAGQDVDTMSYRYENVLRERLANVSVTNSSGGVSSLPESDSGGDSGSVTSARTGTPNLTEPSPSILAVLVAGKNDFIRGGVEVPNRNLIDNIITQYIDRTDRGIYNTSTRSTSSTISKTSPHSPKHHHHKGGNSKLASPSSPRTRRLPISTSEAFADYASVYSWSGAVAAANLDGSRAIARNPLYTNPALESLFEGDRDGATSITITGGAPADSV